MEGSIDEEFDDEAFSELFPKLMEVRSKASCLDVDKRRKMAEKVILVLLFIYFLTFAKFVCQNFGSIFLLSI